MTFSLAGLLPLLVYCNERRGLRATATMKMTSGPSLSLIVCTLLAVLGFPVILFAVALSISASRMGDANAAAGAEFQLRTEELGADSQCSRMKSYSGTVALFSAMYVPLQLLSVK